MTPVTDPALLAQLDSAPAVTDPQPLAQLNAASPAATQAATDTPSWLVPFISAGRTVDKLAAGLRQLMPAPVANAVDTLGENMGMASGRNLESDQAGNDQAYAALQQQHPITTMLGEAAPAMAAKTPLGMAAFAALGYGTPQERATNAAAGYVGAKVGNAIGSGIARLRGPASMAATDASPAYQEFFDAGSGGNKWNIPLSIGQATGSKPAQIAESVMENLPFSAGTMANARDATYGAFNRAIANTFGSDATALTPEVLGAARAKVGGTIGDIADRNTFQIDPVFARQIADLSQSAQTQLAPDSAAFFNKQLTGALGGIDPQTGSMPSTLYKAIDSSLGRIAKNTPDGNLGYQLGQLRQTLRSGMDRSISPDDAQAWQTARRQYANLMTVADAVKNTGDGTMSPARLLQAVNTAQPSARFGSGTDLAELAQWAKPTIGNAVPNSGTAQRNFYQNLIANPLATAGGIAGGLYGLNEAGVEPKDALAGAVLPYALARGLAGRPASALAQLLMRGGGRLVGYGLSQRLAPSLP